MFVLLGNVICVFYSWIKCLLGVDLFDSSMFVF